MSQLLYLFYPWGILLQITAIIHFIRRRPDNYWLWIIIVGGGLGALVYILVEVIPDLGLLRGSFQGFPRRRRINELQALILDNPSAGNYEELADLYLQEKKYDVARQCYDKAISSRTDHADPFYRRALCAMEMGDFPAAVPDLERVMSFDPKYDYHRARGLLAHAYARTGQTDKARKIFAEVVQISARDIGGGIRRQYVALGHRAEIFRDVIRSRLRKERPEYRIPALVARQLLGRRLILEHVLLAALEADLHQDAVRPLVIRHALPPSCRSRTPTRSVACTCPEAQILCRCPVWEPQFQHGKLTCATAAATLTKRAAERLRSGRV